LKEDLLKQTQWFLAVGRIQKLGQELLEIAKKIAKEVYVIGDAKNQEK